MMKNFQEEVHTLLRDLINYLRGRNGGSPTKAHLALADAFANYLATGKVRGSKRKQTIAAVEEIVRKRQALKLTGDPFQDWLKIRELILNTGDNICWYLVGDDARYIRLLNKGKLLREELSSIWRQNGYYKKAGVLVNAALEREYFEAPRRSWKGIFIMTLHKSKGKEFDEVFIVEDQYRNRLFQKPKDRSDTKRASYLFRVGVTRAMKRVTIFTPQQDPCHLFTSS